VERPRAKLSEAPMRVYTPSRARRRAEAAGTKLPTCAMMQIRAHCLRWGQGAEGHEAGRKDQDSSAEQAGAWCWGARMHVGETGERAAAGAACTLYRDAGTEWHAALPGVTALAAHVRPRDEHAPPPVALRHPSQKCRHIPMCCSIRVRDWAGSVAGQPGGGP
jgi:hypothetical protein